jgi:replication factor A1
MSLRNLDLRDNILCKTRNLYYTCQLKFSRGTNVAGLKKINELKPGDREVSLTASIDSISEPRTVNLRAGGTAQVADAIISDETGNIKLSLWDDQIKSVKEGDMISIENGYTQSFRGENNLNIGRYGRLKKL